MSQTNLFDQLLALNDEIGDAESRADTGYFENLLHERFTMRRPSGVISSKADFVSGLTTGAVRETTMTSLQLLAENYAIAECLVRKWDGATPGNVMQFRNLRVFIRDGERWQLLTWLAEPHR